MAAHHILLVEDFSMVAVVNLEEAMCQIGGLRGVVESVIDAMKLAIILEIVPINKYHKAWHFTLEKNQCLFWLGFSGKEHFGDALCRFSFKGNCWVVKRQCCRVVFGCVQWMDISTRAVLIAFGIQWTQ